MPESVVFLDETAVKTNLTRLRGWAPRGERLTMDAPFGSWGTQTLIAGLTHEALIAPWVINGAMCQRRSKIRPLWRSKSRPVWGERLGACGPHIASPVQGALAVRPIL